jgi:lipocalin
MVRHNALLKGFCIVRTALTIAALIITSSVAFAADAVAPSAIVASPSTYDGKSVTVTGTVSNFQTSQTMMGTVAGYQLCDSKCVVVIDETNQAQTNGSSATITGTFHATFKAPRKTFTNAVVISK